MGINSLIAQSKHPSVDAVRIALGNTGSKTTIHKYLKELEEEDGGTGGRKASISEALQDLVERLAAQLQDESNARIDEIRTQTEKQARQHAEALAAARQANDSLNAQLAQAENHLKQESIAHSQTRDALQREAIARHTAEQQVSDLKERLLENENHRRSLEEKHQHAREALEHYRMAAKEQREQDSRRHEQQVQQLQAEIRALNQSLIVKQEETTRLNQEGARLVADLSHAQKAHRDQEFHVRQLEQRMTVLPALEERAKALEAKLADHDKAAGESVSQLAAARARIAALGEQVHHLQIELAASQAKLEAQQTIGAELRTYLAQTQPSQAPEQEKIG